MAKTENYTTEMVTEMVAVYTAAPEGQSEADVAARDGVVANLAEKFGKSPKSIRAKLSRENVYIPKETKSKVTGAKPASKVDLAEKLAAVSGIELNTDSVAKMNKVDIVKLIDAFELTEDEAAEVNADENDSQEGES